MAAQICRKVSNKTKTSFVERWEDPARSRSGGRTRKTQPLAHIDDVI